MSVKEDAPWYADLGVISIGCQNGGPEDHGLGIMKEELHKKLLSSCKSTYCKNVDHFALVMRIGGEFTDFMPEQIHRIRRNKKERYIGCDIDIPYLLWKMKSTSQLQGYLSSKVRDAIQTLLDRLLCKDKEEIDADKLLADIDKGISAFSKMRFPDLP